MSTITGRSVKKVTESGAIVARRCIIKSVNVVKVGSTDLLEIRKNGVGTPASGTVELTGGGSGSVDMIKVNGVEIMSGAENFISDLATTATAVALNITNHTSSPNYTAVAVGAVITITAVNVGDCKEANGFVVESTATTITTEDTNLSGGVGGEIVLPATSLSGIISIPLELAVEADAYAVFTGSTAQVLLVYD